MILLTGQGDQEVDMEAMKAGAADYWSKASSTPTFSTAPSAMPSKASTPKKTSAVSGSHQPHHGNQPRGIVVANQAGTITFANHRAEEVLGLSKDAITVALAAFWTGG